MSKAELGEDMVASFCDVGEDLESVIFVVRLRCKSEKGDRGTKIRKRI